MASVAGIPTAAMGIVVGWLLLLAACFSTPKSESSAYLLAVFNGIGCLGLFIYSLLALGGLCPGCVLYYVLSWMVVALFFFKSPARPGVTTRSALVGSISAAVILGLFAYKTSEARVKIDTIAAKFSEELEASPNFEAFPMNSPFVLAKATEQFADAPLRVSIFSDFQCPICKVFAEMLPKIIQHFRGKLNMQYFFYPLDNSCNSQVSQSFHPMACEAAYLAACAEKDFFAVHNELYAHQELFSKPWLQQLANRFDISPCYHDEKPAKLVAEMLAVGDTVGVKATPTVIINGKKLEGLLPLKLIITIMEKELAKSSK
jgi:hypothetical protein